MNKTLKLNHLSNRCQVINAVIGIENSFIRFDDTGSVTGHVSTTGKKIKQLKLAELLNQNHQQKTLVKIDVEGYETVLIKDLKEIKNLRDYTFFIEVHEFGFNDVGDPEKVFCALKEMKALITDFQGKEITNLQPELITQIVVTFNAS